MSVSRSLVGSAQPASMTATAIAEAPETIVLEQLAEEAPSLDMLRSALVGVLEAQNFQTAADLLTRGEWKLEGTQLAVRLPISEKVVDLSVGADARALLTREATRQCRRVIKLVLSGGGTPQNAPVPRVSNGAGNGNGSSARERAAEDPVVKRMQEKFGAEVRSVIDYRQKK
jgi:DNA polymerase-3 subunit gamma/tau